MSEQSPSLDAIRETCELVIGAFLRKDLAKKGDVVAMLEEMIYKIESDPLMFRTKRIEGTN